MPDPAEQVRRYGAATEAVVPATRLDDVLAGRRSRWPGRAALVAMVAVLVAVVGVAVAVIDRSDPPTGLSTDPSTLDGPAGWDTFPPAPIRGRVGATAVASTDELLIWGGRDQEAFSDGAAYSFEDGTWRTLAPSPLSARSFAVSAWTGREMLVWGGVDDSSEGWLDDGAAYDPATDSWRPLPSPAASLPFVGASSSVTGAAWTGRELVLAGISDATGAIQSDVVALDPSEGWRSLGEVAPSPGGGPARQRAVEWTGTEVLVVTVADLEPVTVDRLDVDQGTWGTRIVTDAPGLDTSTDGVAVVDDRLVVAGHQAQGSIVDLDTGTARPLAPSNSVVRFPVVRAGGALVFGDRWLDLADEQWHDAGPVPDPHGEFPVGASDGQRAYYWGDSACGPGASCTGVVDPEVGLVWTPPGPAAPATTTTTGATTTDGLTTTTMPATRSQRTFPVVASTGAEYLVWAGEAGDNDVSGRADGFAVDVASGVVRPIPVAPIAPRSGATGVWTGTELIVCCGHAVAQGPAYETRSAAAWDPATGQWRTLAPPPASIVGSYATSVWTGTLMVVMAPGAAVATYDPAEDRWAEVAAPPSVDRLPESIWTGEEVVLWDSQYGSGSVGADDVADRGWRWTPGDEAWAPLPALPPGMRTQLGSVAWTGSEVFVWGQSTSDDAVGIGIRWRPGEDAWRPVAPSPQGAVPDPYDGTPGSQGLASTGSGRVLVRGLEGGLDPVALHLYDATTDVWTTLDLQVDGYHPQLEVIDGRVYVPDEANPVVGEL